MYWRKYWKAYVISSFLVYPLYLFLSLILYFVKHLIRHPWYNFQITVLCVELCMFLAVLKNLNQLKKWSMFLHDFVFKFSFHKYIERYWKQSEKTDCPLNLATLTKLISWPRFLLGWQFGSISILLSNQSLIIKI